MIFWHWAGVSPYTSSCDLAGTCVFVKQSIGSILCPLYFYRAAFYRRYGSNLPSSLTWDNSYTLVYSTNPPVSDCGTVTNSSGLEVFPGARIDEIAYALKRKLLVTARVKTTDRICLVNLAYCLKVDRSTFHHFPTRLSLTRSELPVVQEY